MQSGRLNNRCQVFPVNTSRTLYTGDVILDVAESHAKDIVVTSVSSLITPQCSRPFASYQCPPLAADAER